MISFKLYRSNILNTRNFGNGNGKGNCNVNGNGNASGSVNGNSSDNGYLLFLVQNGLGTVRKRLEFF